MLHQMEMSHSNSSEELDVITRIAADYFGVRNAYIALIDGTRQWIKSRTGDDFGPLDQDDPFCGQAIRAMRVVVIEDATRHGSLRDNFLVTGPAKIRFYAGAPLLTAEGDAIGALCIMDQAPRALDNIQRAKLQELARFSMSHILLRRTVGRIDSISGMPNRYQLGEDLDALPLYASGQSRALVYLDMPDAVAAFEIITVLGISLYEKIIESIAGRIRELLGGRANIYHVTETRFALLSSNADVHAFTAYLKTLSAALFEPIESMNVPLNLMSFGGIFHFVVGQDSTIETRRKALAAVHQAWVRQQRWFVYSEAEDMHHRRSFKLLHDMGGAIRGQGLRLVYQPKMDLRSGKYTGAEALLRWDHPELGAVSPAEFIPLMEKTALIAPLTEWVFRTALAQTRRWHARGHRIRMAINLSARNFTEPFICAQLEAGCREFGVDPAFIDIECTEGVWMEDPQILKTLHSIRDLGMRITLDDFGTGYSNFSYLQKLPATVVKLDQSLICDLHSDERDRHIVKSLIALAKSLDYQVVAEGVETKEALAMVKAWGADEVQGYLLDKPLTPEDFWRRLASDFVYVE